MREHSNVPPQTNGFGDFKAWSSIVEIDANSLQNQERMMMNCHARLSVAPIVDGLGGHAAC